MVLGGSGHAQLPPTDGAYLALLRMVPDSENTRSFVLLNDLARAEQVLVELFGMVRPGAEATTDAVIDFAVFLSTRLMVAEGPYIGGMNSFSTLRMEELQSNAGYDFRNVLQTISAGNPPNIYHAITLNEGTDDILDHLLANADLPQPAMESYREIPILQWGEDFRIDLDIRLIPPVFDELGRGANLAFGDRAIFHTIWNQGVKAMIDAQTGRLSALADVENFRLLAEALSAMDVYSALLSENTFDLEATRGTLDRAAYEALLPLIPYRSLATGIGKDDRGFYMGVILVHAEAEAATANVSLLQTKLETESSVTSEHPWSDYFVLDALEISAEGRILSAKIPFKNGDTASSIWLSIVFRRDGLLLHE